MDLGKSTPRITVLMPVRDMPAELLDQAIGSILAQTFGDFEFLIIDDGSRQPETIGTLERRAAQDERMRVESISRGAMADPLRAGVQEAPRPFGPQREWKTMPTRMAGERRMGFPGQRERRRVRWRQTRTRIASGISQSPEMEIAKRIAREGKERPRRSRGRAVTAARHFGLRMARGEWIARQDSDDWSDRERLARQTDFAGARPEVALCGSAAWVHQEDGTALWRTRPVSGEMAIRAAL